MGLKQVLLVKQKEYCRHQSFGSWNSCLQRDHSEMQRYWPETRGKTEKRVARWALQTQKRSPIIFRWFQGIFQSPGL